MRKASFDYDGTLSKSEVQEYAKSLMELGIDGLGTSKQTVIAFRK